VSEVAVDLEQHGCEQVLDIRRENGATTIVLRGDLDLLTIPEVRRITELECDPVPRRLTLDLAGVEFVDSSALHFLTSMHRRLADEGSVLVLASVGDPVRRVLEVAGLEALFLLDPA